MPEEGMGVDERSRKLYQTPDALDAAPGHPYEPELNMNEKVPEWVDKARLCFETCTSDSTIDVWVRSGVIPEPKKRGGKLMWKWATVNDWLENGSPTAQPTKDNDRVVQMREAMREASRRG